MADQKSLTLSIVGKDETKQAFDSVNKNLNITEKQAFNFGKTMDGISSSLSSFGKKMSLGVTAPLVALGGFALESGAQLDTLQGSYARMTKTMGINAEELMKVMQTTSRGSIAQSDLLLSANKAMSLGVIKNTEEMGVLMDIARVKGQTMGLSMSQAFGDLVTGLGRGSAMILDNLGITIKVGEVNEAYAKSIGKTVDQLTSAEMKQALVNSVVNQGKAELKAMGDVAITNQERLAQMTAKLTDLKATLGQQLLPYAVKFAETLVEWGKKLEALSPTAQKTILIVGAILAVIGPLSIALSGLISVVSMLAGAFALLTWPITGIILGITAVIAIGYLLWKHWDDVSAFAVDVWGRITQSVSSAIDTVKNFITGVLATISTAWTTAWTAVKDFIVGIWQGIVEGVKMYINFMVGLIDLIFQAFGTDLVSFLNAFKETVLKIWQGIADFTKLVWDGIVAYFTFQLNAIKFIWDNTFGLMFSYLAEIMGAIVAKINEVFAWITPKIQSALGAIGGMWDAIWGGIDKTTGGVVESVKKQIDALKGWVDSAINFLTGALNKVIDLAKQIGSAVGGFVSKTIDTGAKITGKATGGFVQPGRTYMVGENGPELFTSDRGGTITPNNKLAGGGPSIVVNISGNTLLDNRAGEKIGDMIIKRLKLSNAL
jgi:phage-related protein